MCIHIQTSFFSLAHSQTTGPVILPSLFHCHWQDLSRAAGCHWMRVWWCNTASKSDTFPPSVRWNDNECSVQWHGVQSWAPQPSYNIKISAPPPPQQSCFLYLCTSRKTGVLYTNYSSCNSLSSQHTLQGRVSWLTVAEKCDHTSGYNY